MSGLYLFRASLMMYNTSPILFLSGLSHGRRCAWANIHRISRRTYRGVMYVEFYYNFYVIVYALYTAIQRYSDTSDDASLAGGRPRSAAGGRGAPREGHTTGHAGRHGAPSGQTG
eukprot:1480266-Prymnesium_polylepis.1